MYTMIFIYYICLSLLIEEALKICWLLFYREFQHSLWFGFPAYIEMEVMGDKVLNWLNYEKQRLQKKCLLETSVLTWLRHGQNLLAWGYLKVK